MNLLKAYNKLVIKNHELETKLDLHKKVSKVAIDYILHQFTFCLDTYPRIIEFKAYTDDGLSIAYKEVSDALYIYSLLEEKIHSVLPVEETIKLHQKKLKMKELKLKMRDILFGKEEE